VRVLFKLFRKFIVSPLLCPTGLQSVAVLQFSGLQIKSSERQSLSQAESNLCFGVMN